MVKSIVSIHSDPSLILIPTSLLPSSTLLAFLSSWSYLFFSQLRVLLNLLFFWLPDLVPRHSSPCLLMTRMLGNAQPAISLLCWNTLFQRCLRCGILEAISMQSQAIPPPPRVKLVVGCNECDD